MDAICRSQRGEARLYRRARMVLLAVNGEAVAAIARQLGTNRTRVGDWLDRFRKNRLGGLKDLLLNKIIFLYVADGHGTNVNLFSTKRQFLSKIDFLV